MWGWCDRFVKGLKMSSRTVEGQFVGADAESSDGKNGLRVGDGFHDCE
jgi:hypothetical protein